MSRLEEIRKKLANKSKYSKSYAARKWKNKKIPTDYTYDESMVKKIPTKSQPDTYVRYEDANEFYFSNEWADLRNFFIAQKNRETSYFSELYLSQFHRSLYFLELLRIKILPIILMAT